MTKPPTLRPLALLPPLAVLLVLLASGLAGPVQAQHPIGGGPHPPCVDRPTGFNPRPIPLVTVYCTPACDPTQEPCTGCGTPDTCQPSPPPPPDRPQKADSPAQPDSDGDGMGDDYVDQWYRAAGQALQPYTDPDGDGLNTTDEFRWNLVPVCVPAHAPAIQNCRDHEADPTTGAGGDGWQDGPEVRYWNNPGNDGVSIQGLAFQDSDRTLDTDGDASPNLNDTDSDNDGLLDGDEALTHHTYPELPDSDCSPSAAGCTPMGAGSSLYETDRVGTPGTGDGLNDSAELAAWSTLGPTAWTTNYDGDGIANNLLDPDSDNDGLLDGPEFLLGGGQVRPDVQDTDHDGVRDGDESAWSVDTDGDGHVNANDPDSDNDGLPDKWEVDHHLNMVDPTDAAMDRDGDGLTNLGEYQHGTDLDDMDTENDLLLDGEEVNTYHTDPLFWDTDHDGMPDRFEALYGLDPTNPGDAGADPDGDSFDREQDGTMEKPWPNLDEYRYGRPPTYSEAASGPYLQGTNPKDVDTDKDGGGDGFEAYYGTNPTIPADANLDTDQDGLNWTMEVRHGTDPNDPDTDNDGLCDGGRAANCHFPGPPGNPSNQPGESDYGSVPYLTDSDGDGIPDPSEAQLWDPSASGQAQDVDGDLLNGIIDADSDNDGLQDGEEQNTYGTDMSLADTDHDALNDGDEVLNYLTLPLVQDTDNDGLLDGAEATVHHTLPLVADTDGDTLLDGAEVNTYGTNPLQDDTDSDGLPDPWEVQEGTQAATADASLDPDNDGLSNAFEFNLGTHPMKADSDGDTLPDGYEVQYELDPLTPSAGADADGDGSTNLEEYTAKTSPTQVDTDQDGLWDGDEAHTLKTDPLTVDTDGDSLGDGDELALWNAIGPTAWSTNYDGDAFANNLLDKDSDNDHLGDAYEFTASHTNPGGPDTDHDGLTDYQEVFVYQGRYDPNNPDTDGDGLSDGGETTLTDTNADSDQDGLKNGDETGTYHTDPASADTDCDGLNDGSELSYWSRHGGYLVGSVNRLKTPDVDGDTLKDGIEIASLDPSMDSFTRTDPGRADTDADGLRDDEEAHNNARAICGGAYTQSTPTRALPTPVPGPGILVVANDAVQRATLVRGVLYMGPDGNAYGTDANGLFLQGGYGIRLYLNLPTIPLGESPSMYSSQTAGVNGKLTNPQRPDTDGDHLTDGNEAKSLGTDPTACDTDGDGLGDGLELGVYGHTDPGNVNNPCLQFDSDGGTTRTSPLNADSDGDGTNLLDGVEDANRNGIAEGLPIGLQYCGVAGAETDPSDADSDDDGIMDGAELAGMVTGKRTSPFCFDTDGDGLSDGLEQGVTTPVAASGSIRGTNLAHKVLAINWPTWQKFEGAVIGGTPVTTEVELADSDGDGILDGLEDLNHNGKLGPTDGELNPQATPDTDGDGILDGRELLVAGTYTFTTFVNARGNPASAMQYDGAAFKTDPLKASTDLDGILDGKDLNPKGDGLMLLKLDKFWQYDAIDCCWGDAQYATDLVLRITLETGAGNFALSTMELSNFGKKDGRDLRGQGLAIASQTNPPSPGTGVLKAIDIASDASDTVRFDLPDSIDDFTRARDMKIHVRLDAIDRDDYYDDSVDVSPIRGSDEFYDAGGIDLAAGALQGGNHVPLDANGNGDPDDPSSVSGDGEPGDNDDARLLMDFRTNLVPYFLKNVLGTPTDLGICLAGVDAQHRPCVR
jgi:hypothetical protein